MPKIGFTDLSIPRGTIEVHDNGPPDEGAGLPPPSGRRSPLFHDRYTRQRPFWLDTHPTLVLAVLSAQQEALADLVKGDRTLDPADGAGLSDDVPFLRGWSRPTPPRFSRSRRISPAAR